MAVRCDFPSLCLYVGVGNSFRFFNGRDLVGKGEVEADFGN